MQKPFYDPSKSYEFNYKYGPFGGFKIQSSKCKKVSTQIKKLEPKFDLFGHKLYLPFGIPAGPLINSNFVAAGFKNNFDVCVYKTVRTKEYPCHKAPNILAVHVKNLKPDRKSALIADTNYSQPLSITNSFGVPSTSPKIWQHDMQNAVKSAQKGQVLIGSFQGTTNESGSINDYINDFVLASQLVKETGAQILEANLSCPNEGGSNLLCFDTKKTTQIVKEIKKAIGKNTPLIIKMAYFENDNKLEEFVNSVAEYIDGISAINTIPAKIINSEHEQALPGFGRSKSGVCGSAISWAGLKMVDRLLKIRKKNKYDYKIIGVGGVTNKDDYYSYINKGADVVMSATGAMWNTDLANMIERKK